MAREQAKQNIMDLYREADRMNLEGDREQARELADEAKRLEEFVARGEQARRERNQATESSSEVEVPTDSDEKTGCGPETAAIFALTALGGAAGVNKLIQLLDQYLSQA